MPWKLVGEAGARQSELVGLISVCVMEVLVHLRKHLGWQQCATSLTLFVVAIKGHEPPMRGNSQDNTLKRHADWPIGLIDLARS